MPYTHRLNRRHAGFSLMEVMIFIMIVTVAMLATLSAFARYMKTDNITEGRRLAMLAAEQKLDEMRNFINMVIQHQAVDINSPLNLYSTGKNPLDAAFEYYGPLPLATAFQTGYPGLPTQRPCTFNVPGLAPVANSKGIPFAAVGTVTIINSETNPDPCTFGLEYDGTNNPNIFCVNLYGDVYTDPMNYSSAGVFPSAGTILPKAPFPMDLDGDGHYLSNDPLAKAIVTTGFAVLPVVITIRWMGPSAEVERLDLFAVLTPDSGKH